MAVPSTPKNFCAAAPLETVLMNPSQGNRRKSSSQQHSNTISINVDRQTIPRQQGYNHSNTVTIGFYPEDQLRKLGKALQEECSAHNTARLALNGELHLRLAAECALWNERCRLTECSSAYQVAREQLRQAQASNTQLNNDLNVLRSKLEAVTSRNESLEKQIQDSTRFSSDFAKGPQLMNEGSTRPTILGEKARPMELGSPFNNNLVNIPAPRPKRRRIEDTEVVFKTEDDSCSIDTSDMEDDRP